MPGIGAIAAVRDQDQEMIEGAIELVLAHVAPMGGGSADLADLLAQGGTHLGQRNAHQDRIAVRPLAFIADPVGAQISLFEDMDTQAAFGGQRAGGGVDGAHVAVKHDVGHALAVQDRGQMRGPVGHAALVAQKAARLGPEELVPRVEAAAPDRRPRRTQQPCQPVEERTMRALQHQEDAPVGCRIAPLRRGGGRGQGRRGGGVIHVQHEKGWPGPCSHVTRTCHVLPP